MMEAARTSETLVNFFQTAQRYNPEDSHLSSSDVQDIPGLLWNPKVQYRIHKSSSPDSIQSKINLVHILPLHL
jgi:hypothetical protein